MSTQSLANLAAAQKAKNTNTAKPAETEDVKPAALESQEQAPITIGENDPDAKAAFDAVMAALSTPAVQPEQPVKPADTEVRPQVKQAAPAHGTQPMREIVGEAARTVVTTAAQAYFISRYPQLTLYIDVGFREQHQGVGIVRNVPIRFKDGQFRTDNARVAEALRKHSKFNAMFQEAKSQQLAAYVAGAARARTLLRNNVTAGPAASSDNNDHAMMMREAELTGVEERLFAL